MPKPHGSLPTLLAGLALLSCGGPRAVPTPEPPPGPPKIAIDPGAAAAAAEAPGSAEEEAARSLARCRDAGDLFCEGRALIALGLARLERGARAEAIEAFDAAAALLAVERGLAPADSADLVEEIGYAWDSLGEHAKALEWYGRAIAAYRKIYPFPHPSTAAAHNNMGVALQALDRHADALDHFGEALAIDRAALGGEHPSVAVDLYNVGTALCRLGDGRAAIPYFDQAIRIWERTLPAGDPQIAAARRWIEIAEALPVPEPRYRPPEPSGARLTRQQITDGMRAIADAVARCGNGQTGTVTIRVTIAPVGRVTAAETTGQFAGTPVGLCAARAARSARFPQSEQGITVTFPFKL